MKGAYIFFANGFIFFANGFEETEALAPIDVLRRGGVDIMKTAETAMIHSERPAETAIISAKKYLRKIQRHQ